MYGAGEDPDNDGYSNLEEFVAGTSPTSPAEYLGVEIAVGTGGGLLVSFDTIALAGVGYNDYAERCYTLERTTDGLGPNTVWTAVPVCSDIPGSGQTFVYTNALPATALDCYRVNVWLKSSE